MKMVSVIVPAYNVEAYLEEALQSVANQTYRNWEIVLVDDGSTDSTKAIAERFRQALFYPNQVTIISGPNQGTANARNTGMEHASGAYLLFLDGDDWLESKALEILVAAMEREEDVDFACMGFRRWYQKEQRFKRYRFPHLLRNKTYSGKAFFLTYLRNKYMMMLACGLYRKDKVTEWGIAYDPRMVYGQDVGFQFLYLLRCRKAAMVNYIGMIYRIHSTSVTLNRSREAIEKRMRNEETIKGRLLTIEDLHSAHAARIYEAVYLNVFMESLGLPHKEYRRSSLATAFLIWLHHPITARHTLKSNIRAWKNSF